jgi:DNA polymerase III delta prime subunit
MNINHILNRTSHEKIMVDFLHHFNKYDEKTKKCIYIHGPPGCGKTTFAINVLKSLHYDIIMYDTNDSRTKNIIDSINVNHMSDKSIINIFNKRKSNIAVLMDEVDHMNIGDKGGINSLIKLIRPKKTKRQKEENITHIPIICIGNTSQEKKLKELIKYCVSIELPAISAPQIKSLMNHIIPKYAYLSDKVTNLNKVYQIKLLSDQNFSGNIQTLFYTNIHENTKDLTKRIINNSIQFDDHAYINETDRTIIALLFHENIIDVLKKIPNSTRIYLQLLNEMCFADYVDRITFQKQLWEFNEMSSFIKTCYTSYLFHQQPVHKISEVRFTKVLTKYSTEYNNYGFIQKMCFELAMDKKDMFVYMNSLKQRYTNAEILDLLSNTEITLLDIQRLERYQNNMSDE